MSAAHQFELVLLLLGVVVGLELLARITVELSRPVWELGATSDLGERRIVPITGGQVVGPRLTGEILDNGADWQVVTRDGATLIDTRYLLRLDDGALAYLQTRGFRHGPPEVLARIGRGEATAFARRRGDPVPIAQVGDAVRRWTAGRLAAGRPVIAARVALASFELVNSAHGRAVGDAILQAAAPDEMRGRLGGVFIVVVAGGPRLADLVHGVVADRVDCGGGPAVQGGLGAGVVVGGSREELEPHGAGALERGGDGVGGDGAGGGREEDEADHLRAAGQGGVEARAVVQAADLDRGHRRSAAAMAARPESPM